MMIELQVKRLYSYTNGDGRYQKIFVSKKYIYVNQNLKNYLLYDFFTLVLIVIGFQLHQFFDFTYSRITLLSSSRNGNQKRKSVFALQKNLEAEQSRKRAFPDHWPPWVDRLWAGSLQFWSEIARAFFTAGTLPVALDGWHTSINSPSSLVGQMISF